MTLVDASGNFITDADVTLYQDEAELEEQVSDENGLVDFGSLIAGPYMVVVETEVNGKEYEFNRGVQVVSGATKQYEINIESYVGEVRVQFRDDDTYNKLEQDGLTGILVKENDAYYMAEGLDEYIALSNHKATTDGEGVMLFTDVPVGRYRFIFYVNDEIEETYTVYVDKDEVDYETIYVNAFDVIFKSKTKWNIASLVRSSDNSAVANDYVSVEFDFENETCTLKRSGGLSDVQGSYYKSYYSLDFYWDGMSNWNSDIESANEGELKIEYYDYNASSNVIMTLN
ncbi:carboxypeptidase regulatory-like domain-containing protein [Fulvivirga sp. RKSG066]|nr:carboxypeptidase regulatory-like domain-containing protein [Fulvivirga aurantia]